ncbi:hypothetical protein GA0115246_111441, partial [Streptomyces sp. SolWspMP-sol7th]
MAAAAQDTLRELLHRAWPVCPDHRLGIHLRAAPGAGTAWWCAGRTASDPSPTYLLRSEVWPTKVAAPPERGSR